MWDVRFSLQLTMKISVFWVRLCSLVHVY
jgi:hypothetical protein